MRILVTGGKGFFGKHVVEQFEREGHTVFVPDHFEYDLRDGRNIQDMLIKHRDTEVVVHLAAKVGGIGANAEHPGEFFFDNALMGIQLMEYARCAGVRKFVTIGTVCEYPENPPVPFREKDLWLGYPTPVTAPYGLAKKMLLVQGQAYRAQYGFDAIHLIPTNLYGPGDNFTESGHVVPAIIRKVSEATREEQHSGSVTLWGSGQASREFIFIEDAARAVVLATERYSHPDPVNIGTGQETTIRELAAEVADIYGYHGGFVWDAAQPDGQPRRVLDVSRAKKFGFTAEVSLTEGLQRTVKWYEMRMAA